MPNDIIQDKLLGAYLLKYSKLVHVSLGRNCKYNGGNNLNPKVVEFLKDKRGYRNLSRIIERICLHHVLVRK